MIENFTNLYSLSKTLRFSLIPVGDTEKNFFASQLLEQDEQRAKDYVEVKKYIDEYHKSFIEKVLSGLTIDGFDIYASLYHTANKTDAQKKAMENMEADFREAISVAFKKTHSAEYKQMFGKELINDLLPNFLTEEKEKEIVRQFEGFVTYFQGFFQNRENMYSDEAKATAISYRCINENLPKYLDNALSFAKVSDALSQEKLEALNDNFCELIGFDIDYAFAPSHFTFFLSQSGIDKYNELLGGYTTSDGCKVQGLNEYINLYNQQTAKTDKSKKLPQLKPLYKQILSDRESISFIAEEFSDDNEMLSGISGFLTKANDYGKKFFDVLNEIKSLFAEFSDYDVKGIHVRGNAAITELSKKVFDNWSVIENAWNEKYEKDHPFEKSKKKDSYFDDEKAAYKSIDSFSVEMLQQLGDSMSEGENKQITVYYSVSVANAVEAVFDAYDSAKSLLENKYTEKIGLAKNDGAIELIKNFLDAVKALEWLLKPLCGTGKEEYKDEIFYGKFLPLFDSLCLIDRLYDRVRNYLTKKPYSKDKIKLNFENPQFLGGWDKNKEKDYRCVILRKNDSYYLCVMDKRSSKIFENVPDTTDKNCYEKIEYKLLPGPNKMLPKVFFAKSNIAYYAPSAEILKIRDTESFKKGKTFNIDDCRKMIDFYKESINRHPDWSAFGFSFTPTERYNDIGEFFREVKEQGYFINFRRIANDFITNAINNGAIYLFRIYNKDFSEYSKGKPNLHTLYFKELFAPENLKDVVYKLNGEAEMFFRKASIERKITHPANVPIKNKNLANEKKESVFAYDLIKDKRFSTYHFSLHLPISLNFKAADSHPLNYDVRKSLKDSAEQYVIGIDRGERNLVYICVINGRGEIVEQCSLNEIISDNGYKVNYHDLLDKKEEEREKARINWTTVENIKELKEGYLSQVVHKICELVVKYDAVIALEDLNSGFKNSRIKVEKQVYQKFEKMLTDKLNYLIFKDKSKNEAGGLLKAYQLTNKAGTMNSGRQDGIIFYIPAWLTSKIDPVTGFVDLLKPKYKNAADAAAFFEKFKSIRFNKAENMYEFTFDYADFPKGVTDSRGEWTVYTNGERIKTYRSEKANGNYINEPVVLTDCFTEIFNKYGIDISGDIKEQIITNTNPKFMKELTNAFALTLQMRNSITGDVNVDYLISPVKSPDGTFYDSRNYSAGDALPENADANGAYNIARKVLWAVNVLKRTDDAELKNAKLSITNKDWLAFAQDFCNE